MPFPKGAKISLIIGLVLLLVLTTGCQVLVPADASMFYTLIFFFPMIFLGVYAFFLYQRYNASRKSGYTKKFEWEKFRRPGLIIGTIAVAILIVNLLPEKLFFEYEKKYQYAQKLGDEELELEAYKEALVDHPDSLQLHFAYLEQLESLSYNFLRDDYFLQGLYEAKSKSKNPKQELIGHIGVAYIKLALDEYDDAEEWLTKKEMKGAPFYHFLLAKLYLSQGRNSEAVEHWHSELELDGYKKGAFEALTIYYYNVNDRDALLALIEQDPYLEFIPTGYIHQAQYETGNLAGFYMIIIRHFLNSLNLGGFIGALIITLIWLWYVRAMDVFAPQRWGSVLLVFGVGCIVPFLTFLLGGFYSYTLGMGDQQNLTYWIVRVGMVEEFVKFLPVLLILPFKKNFKEPYDYILYCSVSALGFAFTENLLYFQADKMEIVDDRGFISVVGHMTWSSILGYALVLAKFKNPKLNPILAVIVAWLVASIAHGLFDFFLTLGSLLPALMAIAVLLIGIQLWWTMTNNCMNNSKEFSYDNLKVIGNNRYYLVLGLTSILLLQYILVGVQIGPSTANAALFSSFFRGGFMIVFLGSSLGRFEVFKGHWEPLKIPYSIHDIFIPRSVNPNIYVGREIELWPEEGSTIMQPFLPRKAKIVERRALGRDNHWYLVQTHQRMGISNYVDGYFLVQLLDDDIVMEKGHAYEIALRLLKTPSLVKNVRGQRSDVSNKTRAILKAVD